jgi:hypothetical protein
MGLAFVAWTCGGRENAGGSTTGVQGGVAGGVDFDVCIDDVKLVR